MKRRVIVMLGLLFCFTIGNAQNLIDSKALIGRINTKFLKVKDYQVEALIDTRISFLKILPQRADIYFRQPDKFHVKSKGIAILPKQNFDNLFIMLQKVDSYQSFASGTGTIDGHTTAIINIVPNDENGDLVFAKIWVDDVRDLVLKAQLTTKTNGTVIVDYAYATHLDYLLPDKIIFTVEVKKFKIPKAISADINSTSKPKTDPNKESKTGRIIVTLKNYIINKGIADIIFK
jgi:hypothetical protein